MSAKKKSMIFHYVWRSVFSNLSPAQAKKLLLDIIDYAETGVQPKKQRPEVENAFSLIRYTIDEDTRKYGEKTNRLAANTRKRTKKGANIGSDNVNDNDNDNANENANEDEEYGYYAFSTIINNGDAIGSVIILSLDNQIMETEEKMASIMSKLLGGEFID